LLTSAYGVFLAMPTGIRSTNQGGLLMTRTISLILIVSLLFEISTLIYLPHNSICVFMDGTIKLSSENTYLLIFIQVVALIILQFGVEGGTGALISRISGEVFLVMLVNLVALVYVLIGIDLLVTVVAWELFNLSLYLLVSMQRSAGSKEISLSASVKYFLLSAYTTSFLLLSIALLYGITGTTSYDGLIMFVQTGEVSMWPFYLMMLTFLFKMGAAPLHNWAPDLYDSLPTFITMWMITVPKTTVLFLLTQLNFVITDAIGSNMLLVFGTISLLVGSIGLSSQWTIKRFMTFSSIGNLGFILITLNNSAISYFYIVIYVITTIVIFAIFLSINTSSGIEVYRISDLAGLYAKNPGLAYALAICLFSLMGCPPLIGFFAKLGVIANLLDQGIYSILIVLVLSSVISAANYLSLILVAHLDKPTYNEPFAVSYRNAILISLGVGFIILISLLNPYTF
jgi:NADH-quinone oxidoreductase subunit N